MVEVNSSGGYVEKEVVEEVAEREDDNILVFLMVVGVLSWARKQNVSYRIGYPIELYESSEISG